MAPWSKVSILQGRRGRRKDLGLVDHAIERRHDLTRGQIACLSSLGEGWMYRSVKAKGLQPLVAPDPQIYCVMASHSSVWERPASQSAKGIPEGAKRRPGGFPSLHLLALTDRDGRILISR
ncbi:hypothetical protein H1C71_041662, partial [Ictidomys tridecemlineatus]